MCVNILSKIPNAFVCVLSLGMRDERWYHFSTLCEAAEPRVREWSFASVRLFRSVPSVRRIGDSVADGRDRQVVEDVPDDLRGRDAVDSCVSRE